MMTNTTTTATEPHAGERGREVPYPPGKPPSKPRKRGFIWVFFLVIVISVTAYAVWRASQPGLIPQTEQGKGGRKGGRGAVGGGLLPVWSPRRDPDRSRVTSMDWAT